MDRPIHNGQHRHNGNKCFCLMDVWHPESGEIDLWGVWPCVGYAPHKHVCSCILCRKESGCNQVHSCSPVEVSGDYYNGKSHHMSYGHHVKTVPERTVPGRTVHDVNCHQGEDSGARLKGFPRCLRKLGGEVSRWHLSFFPVFPSSRLVASCRRN